MDKQEEIKTILSQPYISSSELKKVVPQIGQESCRNIIKQAQQIMKDKNYFIPRTNKYLALTSIVCEYLGIDRKIYNIKEEE